MAKAYAGATGEDEARLAGGWFYPGDMARIDAAGFVHLEGRSSDIIKRGGLTVYAAEIERILLDHPAVAEAAVVGVPSPVQGEDIVAFVVLRGEAELAAIAKHCRICLALSKQPREIRCVGSLPRNAGGKVIRAALAGSLALPG